MLGMKGKFPLLLMPLEGKLHDLRRCVDSPDIQTPLGILRGQQFSSHEIFCTNGLATPRTFFQSIGSAECAVISGERNVTVKIILLGALKCVNAIGNQRL